MRATPLFATTLLLAAWAAPARCGDVHDPRTPARGAVGDTVLTAADSALAAAMAATDRFQRLCASDSATVRLAAALAADSARRADSLLADSLRAAAAADSAARAAAAERDSVAPGPSRRTHRRHVVRHPSPAPHSTATLAAWEGVVARRALHNVPLRGSLFPGCRVVAYYGNPLSKRMGILGEIPRDSMLARLDRQAAAYARLDPAVPVIPALELIAIVAQGGAGRDGMYRARMPDTLIEKVARWADSKQYLLILDVQVGRSSVEREIAPLIPYLRRPNVHLALDPEFAMHPGKIPGRVIGTLDAHDVNAAVDTLARLVTAYHLPPKMLIVHRFTRPMLTNQEAIRLDPRVQVVIDMDGFGSPSLKHGSYQAYVRDRPVQFAGFKLFYKNDKPILTPEQVLKLIPVPLFIMYQ